MKVEEKVGLSIFGSVLITLVLLTGGYVMNVVCLLQCDFDAPYKAEVIRGVGVAIPLVGGVAGYIPIEDGKQ